MSTTPVDALHARTQLQVQEVQLRQHAVGSLTNGGKSALTEAQKEKKLREACEGFESIFIQKMWQQMRATVPKGNPLQGREEQFWQGMYDQELSKKMASSGGIGLGDMMYDQLSRNLVSASRTTASALGGQNGQEMQGFTADAVPLLPPPQAEDKPDKDMAATDKAQPAPQDKKGTEQAHTIYAGAAGQPDAQGAAGTQDLAGQTQPGEADPNSASSPVVQQFLAQLRQKQEGTAGNMGQAGQRAWAENTAPAGDMSSMGQSHSTTQIHGQGLSRAMRVQQSVANMPSGPGVMPAMQPAPQAMAAQGHPNTVPVPTVPTGQQAVAPMGQQVGQVANQQVGQQVGQQAHMTQQMQMAQQMQQMQQSQQLAAQAMHSAGQTVQSATQVTQGALSGEALLQSQMAGPLPGAAAAQEEQPTVINKTFTTNVPPKRRSSRARGQRLPTGQPVIRNLPNAPASPMTRNNAAQPAQPTQGIQAAQAMYAAPQDQAQPAAPGAGQPAVPAQGT